MPKSGLARSDSSDIARVDLGSGARNRVRDRQEATWFQMADATTGVDRIDEVLDAETRRCRAIETRDWDMLADLLTKTFQYIHASGRVHDKVGHLELAKRRRRVLSRTDLVVRRYGSVAVMTGGLTMRFPESEGASEEVNEYFVVQVWVEQDGTWKLDAYQSSK